MNSTAQNPQPSPLSKYTRGFGISLAIASLFNALLVVAKESNPKMMTWMKGITGHHWVTHGVFTVALFVILGFVISRAVNGKHFKANARSLTNVIVGSVIVSGLIIVSFYLIEG